jgi:hypothetical protein
MHMLMGHRQGRSSTPALVLAALAVAGLLAYAARELARGRRRAHRRTLLAVPEERQPHAIGSGVPENQHAVHPDDAAVEELRERPRPVGPGEAARILGVAPEALASLNLPATPAPDGRVVYDSWEIVHWVDVRRTDPAGFEARTARR